MTTISLEPLAAKMFLGGNKAAAAVPYIRISSRMPQKNSGKTHFYEEKRSGRVPGEALDFQIIYPIAQEEAKGAWKDLQTGGCESLYSGTDVKQDTKITSGSGRLVEYCGNNKKITVAIFKINDIMEQVG